MSCVLPVRVPGVDFRKDTDWYVAETFRGYLERLENFVEGDEFYDLPGLVDGICIPPYHVRDLYRRGSYFVSVSGDSAAVQYVMGCLGHNVARRIRKHPRLCALWAAMMVGGRWRAVESVVAGDHVAMYMYSRHVVRGRLPSEMHNRMVLESYVEVTSPMRLYFDQFGGI